MRMEKPSKPNTQAEWPMTTTTSLVVSVNVCIIQTACSCSSWVDSLACVGRRVSFSLRVGVPQKVMAAAAAGPAGVHMELGGKSAMIVFDDIEDIEATVDW